jgi:hypothetical protein
MIRDKIEIEQENSNLIEFIVHPETSHHFCITLIPEYHEVFKKYLLSAFQTNHPAITEIANQYILPKNITKNKNQFKISRHRATSGIVLGFLSLINPKFIKNVDYFEGNVKVLESCKRILTEDRTSDLEYKQTTAPFGEDRTLISAVEKGKWYGDEIRFSGYCINFDNIMQEITSIKNKIKESEAYRSQNQIINNNTCCECIIM